MISALYNQWGERIRLEAAFPPLQLVRTGASNADIGLKITVCESTPAYLVRKLTIFPLSEAHLNRLPTF